jgi:cell wall-associated NlpC family hydrolase
VTTIAYVLILAAVIIARQTAKGRAFNLTEDLSDAFLALARGDQKGLAEVFSRTGDAASLTTGEPGTFSKHVAGGSGTTGIASAAVELGKAAKGYRWAATGPDYYDCSGLMWRATQKAGVFPKTGVGSARFTTYDVGARPQFTKVTDPTVGDLVVWPTHHMGVVTGDDKYYSARSVKTGIGYSTISGHGGSHYYLRAKGNVASNDSQKDKVEKQLKGA